MGSDSKASSRASTQQKRLLEARTAATDWVIILIWITQFSAARQEQLVPIMGDRVKVTSLAVPANEEKTERSNSDQAIVVGGDWADTSTDNTVLETMAAIVLFSAA